MNYPFSDFCRHIEKWSEFKDLQEVRPVSNPSQVIPLGALTPHAAQMFRAGQMFASEGCTKEETEYRIPRFCLMAFFLSMHVDFFKRAGFFILDVDSRSTAPAQLLRAIHETFRGDIPENIGGMDPQSVVDLANGYGDTWTMGDAD